MDRKYKRMRTEREDQKQSKEIEHQEDRKKGEPQI